MLLELRIENLLLIERAELRLGRGLNAITGETGAGKTVLAHSLDLIMGGKARPQIVRPGASEAYVEGVFELPEGLLDEPELAEIAERLPEGETEIVVGQAGLGVGQDQRVPAGALGHRAGAAGARLAPARLLRPARAPQADPGERAARDARRVRGRRADRAAARATATPTGGSARSRPSWPRCASARARASATSTCCASSWGRSRRPKPDPAEEAELAPERDRLRHAEALRGAASIGARGGRRRRRGGRAPPRRSPSPSPRWPRQEGVDPALDELRCARGGADAGGARAGGRAPRLRRGRRGLSPAGWPRSRSAST